MPSHQDRREPLTAGYQFGDAKPQTPKRVVVTKPAYRIMLRMFELLEAQDHLHCLRAPYPTLCAIQLADMTFVQED